jgi:hypothetical protein
MISPISNTKISENASLNFYSFVKYSGMNPPFTRFVAIVSAYLGEICWECSCKKGVFVQEPFKNIEVGLPFFELPNYLSFRENGHCGECGNGGTETGNLNMLLGQRSGKNNFLAWLGAYLVNKFIHTEYTLSKEDALMGTVLSARKEDAATIIRDMSTILFSHPSTVSSIIKYEPKVSSIKVTSKSGHTLEIHPISDPALTVIRGKTGLFTFINEMDYQNSTLENVGSEENPILEPSFVKVTYSLENCLLTTRKNYNQGWMVCLGSKRDDTSPLSWRIANSPKNPHNYVLPVWAINPKTPRADLRKYFIENFDSANRDYASGTEQAWFYDPHYKSKPSTPL